MKIKCIIIFGMIFLFTTVFATLSLSVEPSSNSSSIYKYNLLFQESMFNVPQNRYYSIKIDLDNKKFLSYCSIEKSYVLNRNLKLIKLSYLKLIQKEGEFVKILDVSPDNKWISVLHKTQLSNTIVSLESKLKKDPIYIHQALVIDVEKMDIKLKLPILSPCYFSNDSIYANYIEGTTDGWNCKRINLNTNEVKNIMECSSFFLFPKRDGIVFFLKNKIWVSDINGNMKKNIGKYKNLVYESGIIDNIWGYFITTFSSKGGDKELFFINLKNYNIIRYPYITPELRLMNIIKN